MHDWNDEFTDEIGELLADDPVPIAPTSGRKLRAVDPTGCCDDSRPESGDLFALLAIPWTDHETTEFLRLVGLDDRHGN